MSLELKHLSKNVAQTCHLRDISLEFSADSFNVILGPALAGKTSLLRLIAGLDKASSGSILLQGEDITSRGVQQRNTAFVYQEFVNYPTLSVYENIASPLSVRRENKKEIKSRVMEVAELLGIQDLLDRRPTELSGGQQQRVAIGRALTKDADVILLDEPLANLDYKLREDLRRELPRIVAGRGKIVLYATTDPAEAFLLGGNLTILDEGSVQQVGNAAEIFAGPDNLAAAKIMSDVPLNQIAVTFKNGRCEIDQAVSFTSPGHMRELPDGLYTLGFRAEHVSLQSQSSSAVPQDVKVSVAEITGSETIVHFELAGSPCVAIVGGSRSFDATEHSTMYFDVDQMFAFNSDGSTAAVPAASANSWSRA